MAGDCAWRRPQSRCRVFASGFRLSSGRAQQTISVCRRDPQRGPQLVHSAKRRAAELVFVLDVDWNEVEGRAQHVDRVRAHAANVTDVTSGKNLLGTALVAAGAPRADPLIGLAIVVVILKITWDSWRVVSTREPGEIDQGHAR